MASGVACSIEATAASTRWRWVVSRRPRARRRSASGAASSVRGESATPTSLFPRRLATVAAARSGRLLGHRDGRPPAACLPALGGVEGEQGGELLARLTDLARRPGEVGVV